MNRTVRNLAIAGTALEMSAGMWASTMINDIVFDGMSPTMTTALIAIGMATVAVIGVILIMTAVIITALKAVTEDAALSYNEGVLRGVREGIDATVGRLIDALPSGNIHHLRPQPGSRDRR